MENAISKKHKVGHIIVDVAVWVLIILAGLITFSVFSSQGNGGVANMFGFMPMTIQTGSMAPTIKPGDLVITKKVADVKSIKKDDIISFWTIIGEKRVINTHRVVEVNADGSFTTKGDANDKNDAAAVYPADLIGRYTGTKIGGIGKVVGFLQSSTGFLFCVVLPLILFFLYQVYKFITVIIETKKPKLSQEDEDEIKKKAIEEYLQSQKNVTEEEKTEV